MNIYVPEQPKRLQVTQTMVEDFLCDPVLGAKVIMGREYDAFQKLRMRHYWWVPNGEDSSGISTGKTIVDFDYVALRCILMAGHAAGVYYPVHETGKLSFWKYFQTTRSPIFRAQLGRLDDDGDDSKKRSRSEASACFKAFYRNGSETLMPAPSFVKDAVTQQSIRLNTLLVEEWPAVDAMGDGINTVLIERVSKPSFNQYHPVWANHIHFTGSAKQSVHPAYKRHKAILREVKRGNPIFFHFRACFKDWSDRRCHTGKSFKDEYRIKSQIDTMRASLSPDELLAHGHGLWSECGEAFYPKELLDAAVEIGRARGVTVLTSRKHDPKDKDTCYYFLGVDPAPAQGAKSDDGAFVLLRARPLVEREGRRRRAERAPVLDNPSDYAVDVVYARRMRNARTRQWSGLMHHLDRRFILVKVGMDWNGGGNWIKKDLAEPRQLIENIETEVRPIVTPDDVTVADGKWILVMVKRGDPGIESIWPDMQGDDVLTDRQHTVMQEALRSGLIGFPPDDDPAGSSGALPFRDQAGARAGKGEEWMLAVKCLKSLLEQLEGIGVLKKEDGTLELTKNVARKFVSRGKKDFVSALLNAYTAFLCWLKDNTGEGETAEEERFLG